MLPGREARVGRGAETRREAEVEDLINCGFFDLVEKLGMSGCWRDSRRWREEAGGVATDMEDLE